jgi:hypothetical protein
MSGIAAPVTLFGVPLALRRTDAELLLQALRTCWHTQAGRGVGDLGPDLIALQALFAPTSREQTLRRRLEALQLADIDAPFLNDRLGVRTERGVLITPDGRIVIEVLSSLLPVAEDTVVLESTLVSWAIEQAYEFYRSNSLTRLDRVLALRAGTDEPLRYPSVGFVLLLLINRSVDPARAIRRPGSENDRRALDEALQRPVKAFADSLHGSGRRRSEHFSLYGGYVVTEARRRLSEHLSRDPAAIYVLPGHEEAVVEFLARDLRRRSTLTPLSLENAFSSLVDSYRHSQAALAALGLAFERPSVTGEIRHRLLAAFVQASGGNEH